MSDRYQDFVRSSIGKVLVKNLGLPNPVPLKRYRDGAPLVEGTAVIAGAGRLIDALSKVLGGFGAEVVNASDLTEKATTQALIFDATGIKGVADLAGVHDFFAPLLRRLATCGRVVVVGTPPEQCKGEERIAQRALEGFTRSLGKEIGRGSTVQLVYVAEGAEEAIASTLGFLCSAKSAYVNGQVIRIGTHGRATPAVADWTKSLAGKVAVVTGASRGIGEQIAATLTRDGAKVVGVDVPQAAADLVRVMNGLGGDYLALDITQADAPQRLAHHLKTEHGGADIIVHNAGITRDKRLVNMGRDRWDQVMAVNLIAPERITQVLLDEDVINEDGRIIGVSSIAGIAGNTGQTNYAASKAGVIGMVDALAGELPKNITINAVAPGFIITAMTAAVPFATREVGQRLNSMNQGGLPIDVAETVGWYASPGSGAVSGNVVRVCGLMALGA